MGNAKQISQNKDDIATVMWRDVNRATVVNKAIGTIKADITTNTACCAANKAATDTNKADIQNDAAAIAANKVYIQASAQEVKTNRALIVANRDDIENHILTRIKADDRLETLIVANKADIATNTACCAANAALIVTNKADIKANLVGASQQSLWRAIVINTNAIKCNRFWMSSSALTTIPNDAFDKSSC